MSPSGRGPLDDPDLPPLDPARPDTPWNARATEYAALEQVEHPHARWWRLLSVAQKLAPRPAADEAQLTRDAEAVRAWLVNEGWTQARVTLAIEPEQVWWTKHAERWVTARIIVDEGPRERVGRVWIDGDDALPIETRSKLVRALPPPGTPTSPVRRDALVRTLVDALRDDAWPASTITVEPIVRADATVDLRIHIDPGQTPTLAPFEVVTDGVADVDVIASRLSRWLPAGRTWEGRRARVAVERLQLHPEVERATLDVRPGDPTAPKVTLDEAPTKSVKVSPYFSAPGSLLAAGVAIDWHRRLGPGLATISGSGNATVRLFDGPPGRLVTGAQVGPSAIHTTVIEASLAPLARLDVLASATAELDTQRGYGGLGGRGEAGLVFRPTSTLTLSATFRGGWTWHFPWPQQKAPFMRAFEFAEVPLERSYDSLAAVLKLQVDTRVGGDLPTQGLWLNIEAIPVGSSLGQRWARGVVDLRWFAPVVPDRFTLMVGFDAGFHDIEESEALGGLLSNRFFLGGLTTVRGFGSRRLGPPGSYGGLDGVLQGGDAMLMATLEGRLQLHPDVMLTAFADVGRTWDAVRDLPGQRGVHLDDLQPTAGAGLLVRTPIGAVGGWLGVRLRPEIDIDGDVPRTAFHFMVAEDF